MTTLLDLVQEYAAKYYNKSGRFEVIDYVTHEHGRSPGDPQLFTPEKAAAAAAYLGTPVPSELLEVWEWAGNRLVQWVSFGFMPHISRAVINLFEQFEVGEAEGFPGGRVACGLPELQPRPGIMIADQDRVKLIMSLRERDYGHLWIWRGGVASAIEHSTWTSPHQFLQAQINWLDGPHLPGWEPHFELVPDPKAIAHLNIPDPVSYALSLQGPDNYWY